MLDIYYIDETIKKCPDDTVGLVRAGGVDMYEHLALSNILEVCEKNGLKLDFQYDTLICHRDVERFKEIFETHKHIVRPTRLAREAFQHLSEIFQTAIDNRCGLAAFAD